ncbi:MAG: 16S rRNA (guanine(966)-N(2))-methyltransferase RsmD [Desulfobacteraceae bacterium]|nr:16S rRNA (guanine(966)-N(2))-methyltransferase RsmD [Desulfobacteraceae bacterium]
MRIISGLLKGRKIKTVKGMNTRPTSDRVRESLFNILNEKPKGAKVLDLFAGTGALGLEALSRGASDAVFIDYNHQAISVLRQNIHLLGLKDRAKILQWDISKNLKCLKAYPFYFNLVFLDPPYGQALCKPALIHIQRQGSLAHGAVVVIEHEASEVIDYLSEDFFLKDTRIYGRTALSFFSSQ